MMPLIELIIVRMCEVAFASLEPAVSHRSTINYH